MRCEESQECRGHRRGEAAYRVECVSPSTCLLRGPQVMNTHAMMNNEDASHSLPGLGYLELMSGFMLPYLHLMSGFMSPYLLMSGFILPYLLMSGFMLPYLLTTINSIEMFLLVSQQDVIWKSC